MSLDVVKMNTEIFTQRVLSPGRFVMASDLELAFQVISLTTMEASHYKLEKGREVSLVGMGGLNDDESVFFILHEGRDTLYFDLTLKASVDVFGKRFTSLLDMLQGKPSIAVDEFKGATWA